MYTTLERKLAAGGTIILDGGTGTEIQRRGAPMDSNVWCAHANFNYPNAVRETHIAYIEAGADVITANTFASSPLLFNYLDRDVDVPLIDKRAVKLAREAMEEAGREVAIAGSFSTVRPIVAGSDRIQPHREWSEKEARSLMKRKAEGLAEAGVDFIIMEAMRDHDYSLWATEAAVATGLPIWVGISVEADAKGTLTGFARQDQPLEVIASDLTGTGARAFCIMHTAVGEVDASLAVLKKHWHGPFGVYPESGYFKMPLWQFVDIIPEQKFVAKCKGWWQQGARILGGCCGIGPSHIKALAAAFA